MTIKEAIQGFVNEITNTTKRNEKVEILKKWRQVDIVYRLLNIVYNPFLVFGVTAKTVQAYYKKGQYAPTTVYADIFPLLEDLASKKITGNTALSACAHFLLVNPYTITEECLLSIFDKDMKLGVDTKTINEAWGDCIPTYDIPLAHDLKKSPSFARRLETDNYLIMQKMDGVRANGFWQNGTLTFKSRTGREYTGLDRLKENLIETVLKDVDDCVFDGEICVMNPDGTENFIQAVSEVKRKNFTMERPHYKLFDCVSHAEFARQKQSNLYSERLRFLHNILPKGKTPFASVLAAVRYSPEAFDKARAIALQRGWEGLILRADAPYKAGRSSDLLKYKVFMTEEFKVIDTLPTVKQMKGLNGLMEDVECLGSLVISIPGGTCKVGSGFSDIERVAIYQNPQAYIGRMITVKFFEYSKDEHGDPSLRFPIFQCFRDTVE